MHYLGGFFFSILSFDYPLTFIYVWMKVTKYFLNFNLCFFYTSVKSLQNGDHNYELECFSLNPLVISKIRNC